MSVRAVRSNVPVVQWNARALVRPLVAVAAAIMLAASPVRAEDLSAPPPRTGDIKKDEKSGLHYLEIVTGGGVPDSPLPVVIAIHGLGDNPESFRLLLDDLPAAARLIVPRGPMPHGEDGYSWFDFHSADDREGARELGAGIREAAERVAQLAGSVIQQHGDPARIVVCGFSQGGILSYALASAHPELVAVAIPVAGYLPPALWPAERPKVRPLPKIMALHGEADRLISLESAKWTVEALKSNGYDTSLKTWPGIGHAMVPDIRSTLMTSVVAAVESLAPAGSVLEGPQPFPVLPELDQPVKKGPDLSAKPADNDALKGFHANKPAQLDAPSPLEEKTAE